VPPRARGSLKPPGQIRQSQIVTTFGPGAMVDLPDHAVIIGGLDHWTRYEDYPITEERLAAKVKALLKRDTVKFFAPPPDDEDPSMPITGITVWLFPEWFVAQSEERKGDVRSRPLVYRTDLDRGMTYRRDRERPVKVSHLLITTVALDCGYASSSIRERIYSGESGYGVLLYTASPDAEGTLGGLVESADRIDCYLRQAIELGQLCSNDPVCAQHRPDTWEEDRFLHGAACHGCLLLAEVSCERRNDFLDRALVVPTVDGADAAFFDEA
jgi:uncharacterized protein DUF1998